MSASMASLITGLSRLSLALNQPAAKCIHTKASPLLFKASQQLCAEPMKKKKKIDPGILHARENKKLKRIEKQIRKLERMGRILKPVDEIEAERRLFKQQEMRKRERTVLSFEESERRALLYKEWTRYKTRQHNQDMAAIRRLQMCQDRALNELRAESEELYQKAIQLDEGMLQLEIKGPYATPPIPDFEPLDGEYKDITRKYEE